MDRKCFICSADLGPWESESCISCAPGTRWTWHLSNAERALQVLEAEKGPIGVYDVLRGIKREFGGEPRENSIWASTQTLTWEFAILLPSRVLSRRFTAVSPGRRAQEWLSSHRHLRGASLGRRGLKQDLDSESTIISAFGL